MRKLLFILTLLLLHFCNVKAQVTQLFSYTGSLQEWTVPNGVFEIYITASGAQGGSVGTEVRRQGSRGAQTNGLFIVQPGDQFIILVGGMGGSDGTYAGGGGGTFFLKIDPASPYQLPDGRRVTPLMVAGGGGGGYNENAAASTKGNDETWGGNTSSNRFGDPRELNGGDEGEGGEGTYAGGGGGFLSNGQQLVPEGVSAGTFGLSFLNGGNGGAPSSPLYGGFGGGGAGYPGANGGSGGGGGWSGGAGGRGQRGGGGGSYNAAIPETVDNQAGVNAGPGSVLITYTVAVLPINLLSFSAHLQADINLKWRTVRESNSSYFDIERSTDGRSFVTIGRVAATGNSYGIREYSYTDLRPMASVNHYRLKMVDSDGKFTYSKIVAIRTETAATRLQVFPNPTMGELQLQTGLKGTLNVSIYDAKGSQIKNLVMKSAGMVTSFPINVSDLQKGVYYLKVQGEDGAQTSPFIKK